MNSDIQLVHRSSTRRKACFGCIKAKRRCDQTFPACSRCAKRDIACQYEDDAAAVGVLVEKAERPSSSVGSVGKSHPHDDFSTPYDSFCFPELRELSPQQMEFCTSLLRGCVSSLVLENRNPFIHPSLYSSHIPDAFQDCLGVCALYTQKTSQNRDLIFRMLDAKLNSLVATSGSVYRPEESLLLVQALLMYQVIRVFDGDARQRANADRDFNLLESWTLRLQEDYFEADLSMLGSKYQQWILLESIRRTIMVSVIFRSLCQVMKHGVCDSIPLMAIMPVSNGGNWEDESSGRSELVTYSGFVEEWNDGRVDKVGDYERLLLKVCCHAKC